MELTLYQIDAFASRVFEGNPAAVCPLAEWLPEWIMQSIAQENNLSETAFFVPAGDGFEIRWFTPKSEVDLCGHATLAAAHVLFNILGHKGDRIAFDSRSGRLSVAKDEDRLIMDFPAQPPMACDTPEPIIQAFDKTPVACLKAEDYLVVFSDEAGVCAARPDFSQLMALDLRGVIITARSNRYDFVSRFFAPKLGVYEDPVTGSAYTQLAPYWASRLGDREFRVKQVSSRGGELTCEVVGDRVFIAGRAVTYLTGKIETGLHG